MKRIAVLAAGALLAAVLLSWATSLGAWPGWAGVLLTAVVFLAASAAAWWSWPALEPAVDHDDHPAPPPPPPAAPPAQVVRDVHVPSGNTDYRFLLSAVVCWRARGNPARPLPADPGDMAKREVIARASQITVNGLPNEYDLVQHRVDSALAAPVPDRTGAIDVWAHSVSLKLTDEDLERQTELAAIRKNEEVWEHSRRYNRNVRNYLRNEVLTDTGSGVLWYLAKDPDKVHAAVELIGTFAQLSAAANNREVDPVFRGLVGPEPDDTPAAELPELEPPVWQPPAAQISGTGVDQAADSVRSLTTTLFDTGAEAERARFADRLARLVEHYGKRDLAARIREDFDVPDLDVPDHDTPAEDVPAEAWPAEDVPNEGGAAPVGHLGGHAEFDPFRPGRHADA